MSLPINAMEIGAVGIVILLLLMLLRGGGKAGGDFGDARHDREQPFTERGHRVLIRGFRHLLLMGDSAALAGERALCVGGLLGDESEGGLCFGGGLCLAFEPG